MQTEFFAIIQPRLQTPNVALALIKLRCIFFTEYWLNALSLSRDVTCHLYASSYPSSSSFPPTASLFQVFSSSVALVFYLQIVWLCCHHFFSPCLEQFPLSSFKLVSVLVTSSILILIISQTRLRYVWLMAWQIRLSVTCVHCTLLMGFNFSGIFFAYFDVRLSQLNEDYLLTYLLTYLLIL